MKKNSAIPWWGWCALVLAVILGIIAYTHLPGQIIGNTNRLIPRRRVVLYFWYEPAIMLGIILLWQILWRIDPRRKSYESFWSTYRYIGGVIVVCIGLVYLVVLGHVIFRIAVMRLIPTALGVGIMLIANVLPRIQPNWWIGVRTPWTLSSTECWTRTHRLAGQLGIPAGVIIIVLSWILPVNRIMSLAVLVTMLMLVVITAVASFFYTGKHKYVG